MPLIAVIHETVSPQGAVNVGEGSLFIEGVTRLTQIAILTGLFKQEVMVETTVYSCPVCLPLGGYDLT